MDILAQVLNTLQSNDSSTPEASTESTTSSDNTPIQQHNILPNDNAIDPNGGFYQQPTNDATIGYSATITNPTERLTEFPRYASTYQSNENYYNFDNRNKQTSHPTNTVDLYPTTVIPNNEFYYNYNSPTMGSNSFNLTNHNYVGYNMNNIDSSTVAFNSSPMVTGHLEKSKSKSVPDILKELNDELRTSEMKRQRNNSQSIASPTDGEWKFLDFFLLFLIYLLGCRGKVNRNSKLQI